MTAATYLKALILGWSVAWPPGPVNAEMIRRGLAPSGAGGGAWPAWQVGVGACFGDFLWALSVAIGAGALLNQPVIRSALGILSFLLLLWLASLFGRGAVRAARNGGDQPNRLAAPRRREGLLLGFVMALTSPFNLSFWLAVMGQQSAQELLTIFEAVAFATCVVTGALAWTIVLCVSLKFGARFFAKPGWQVATQAITAGVMLYFAVRLAQELWLG